MATFTGKAKRRSILALGLGSTLTSGSAALAKPSRLARRETCGQEMARAAEVPERLGKLWAHVADNMEAHARFTDASATGAAESTSLMEIVRHYRAIVESAEQAARVMRAMEALPQARHDGRRVDMPALQAWMRKKIAMQRGFANLLLRHARESEVALHSMRPADPPAEGPP